jgi:SAM-dependent methyltransferase
MAMLKTANVTSKDYVIDLGSGDGRIPIAAAKHFGAKTLGIEYNPQMVQLAQCYVRAEGLSDTVQIREADIFKTDFSDATVVTMYLLSDLNLRLRPTILKLKPGTRVVSNSFDMGDWHADEDIEAPNGYSRGYLWIVPAEAKGAWTFSEEGGDDRFQLQIEQTFQEIDVTVPGNTTASVSNAALRGADIEFSLSTQGKQARSFKGKVNDDTIRVSTTRGGKTVNYVGRRARGATTMR